MTKTFTQIHIHSVFAVQNRRSLIQNTWKSELFKYITGILSQNGHKLLAINGMPDHIHLLFGFRPDQSISDTMQKVKRSSSLWINKNKFVPGHFSWQEGFAAFSYSRSQLKDVIRYIENQELYHQKKSFSEECRELMRLFGVSFDEGYILKDPS